MCWIVSFRLEDAQKVPRSAFELAAISREPVTPLCGQPLVCRDCETVARLQIPQCAGPRPRWWGSSLIDRPSMWSDRAGHYDAPIKLLTAHA